MTFKSALFEYLKTNLLSGISGLAAVTRYRGEFESGAEYDPAPPAEIFIRFEGSVPVVYTAGNAIGKTMIPLTVFIAAQDSPAFSVLALTDSVEAFFDGRKMHVTTQPAVISPPSAEVFEMVTSKSLATKLLGYLPDGWEIYQLEVEIS